MRGQIASRRRWRFGFLTCELNGDARGRGFGTDFAAASGAKALIQNELLTQRWKRCSTPNQDFLAAGGSHASAQSWVCFALSCWRREVVWESSGHAVRLLAHGRGQDARATAGKMPALRSNAIQTQDTRGTVKKYFSAVHRAADVRVFTGWAPGWIIAFLGLDSQVQPCGCFGKRYDVSIALTFQGLGWTISSDACQCGRLLDTQPGHRGKSRGRGQA
jgi:hypothetical protein